MTEKKKPAQDADWRGFKCGVMSVAVKERLHVLVEELNLLDPAKTLDQHITEISALLEGYRELRERVNP